MEFKVHDTIEIKRDGRTWNGILLSLSKIMGVIGRVYVQNKRKYFVIGVTNISQNEINNEVKTTSNLEIRHTRIVLTEKKSKYIYVSSSEFESL